MRKIYSAMKYAASVCYIVRHRHQRRWRCRGRQEMELGTEGSFLFEAFPQCSNPRHGAQSGYFDRH